MLTLRWMLLSLLITFAFRVHAEAAVKSRGVYLAYEQRVALSYLLLGVGANEEKQTEIVERLKKTVRSYMEKEPVTVQVSSLREYIEAYRGDWPNSYSLDSDLRLIEEGALRGRVKIVARNARVQQEIDEFRLRQVQGQAKKIAVAAKVLDLSQLSSIFSEKDQMAAAFQRITKTFQEQMKIIETSGAQAALDKGFDVESEGMKTFVSVAFREYFSRMSLEAKKQIVNLCLGADLNASPIERFEMMVLASGPQFQKLLQILARDTGVGEALLQIFRRLESNVPPIPAPIVKEIVEKERTNYNWAEISLDPLGTGTMAQVHKAAIITPQGKKKVVVRFLKPEIVERVKDDERILLELAPIIDAQPEMSKAGFPKIAPLVKDLNRMVADELDLEMTRERQRTAVRVYKGHEALIDAGGYKNVLVINVPGIIEPRGRESNLMVQELISGEKLDSVQKTWSEALPDLKPAIVEELARIWVRELMFGSGYFHSDLHQGNFLVSFMEPKSSLHILDFGMAGQISREIQRDMTILAAGVSLAKPSLIADTFWSLSLKNQNVISKSEFETKVKGHMKFVAENPQFNGIGKWTSWSIEQGLRFPYEFVSMNRGISILDRLLNEAGSKESVASLGKSLGPRYGVSLIRDLRSSGKIGWWDVMRLGWSSLHEEELPMPEASTARVVGGALSCRSLFAK